MPEGSYRLSELAEMVGGTVEGDGEKFISGVAPLDRAGASELTFLANPKYLAGAREAKAGAILAGPDADLPGKDLIRVKDPYLAVARILTIFHPEKVIEPGVRPGVLVGEGCVLNPGSAVLNGAVIGDRVKMGQGVVVHAGAVIGDDCFIGEATVIHPNVTLYPRTKVGSRVILHAGVVLGSDGFGFAADSGEAAKIPQVGNVIVEDDVEIGANSTVDRATFGSTIIGKGTKIDNLVQVAHNVVIGPGSILVAQSGVAGSTTLGKGVIIAGQSGAVGHINIGDGARIGAKSAVTSDLSPGAFVIGHPAIDAGIWKRATIAFAKLPEMLRRIRKLEKRSLEGTEQSKQDKEV